MRQSHRPQSAFKTTRATTRAIFLTTAFALIPWADSPAAALQRDQIEADWLRQAEAWQPKLPLTQADAAGAVDGVKDGKYAFHTAQEKNPWWQVDLGEPVVISRIVVFNRLDYAPGLHNADNLCILASDDARHWKPIHENRHKYFGGISGAPPLEVRFPAGEVRARFVRLQIPSEVPIFFHLDEVEIYGPGDPAKNLALHQPADQSSVSIWSTPKVTHQAQKESWTATADHVLSRARAFARSRLETGWRGYGSL